MVVGPVDHTFQICMSRHTADCNCSHTVAAVAAAAAVGAAGCYYGHRSVEHRQTPVDWLHSGVTSGSCNSVHIEDTAGRMHQDSHRDSQPDLEHPSVASAEPDELAYLEQEYFDHYSGHPVGHSLPADELKRTGLACLERSCRTHYQHVGHPDHVHIGYSRLDKQRQHHDHSTVHTAVEQRQVQSDQASGLRTALVL